MKVPTHARWHQTVEGYETTLGLANPADVVHLVARAEGE
jgi:hypothetical protein